MNNHWDKLSITQKNDLIGLYVKNGVTRLDTIRDTYNSFKDGGRVNVYNNRQKQQIYSWLDSRRDILMDNAKEQRRGYPLMESAKTLIQDQFDNLESVYMYDLSDDIPDQIHPVDQDAMIRQAKQSIDFGDTQVDLDTAIKYNKMLYDGAYYPSHHFISINKSGDSTKIHELTHSLRPGAQIKKIDNIKQEIYNSSKQANSYIQPNIEPSNYTDGSNEIYSRMMEFRIGNDLDPKKKVTKGDIKEMRKNQNVKDYDLLDRYDDEFLEKILNDVASNNKVNSNKQRS